jgi:hypothetical protein
MMKKISAFLMTALFFVLIVSCEKEQVQSVIPSVDPMDISSGDVEFRGDDCFNFNKAKFESCFSGVYFEIGDKKYQGLGACAQEGWAGNYKGWWSSYVFLPPTQNGKGAIHYKLVHKFWIDEFNYFYTEDRAVCAPAKGTSDVCIINDQMSIAGGVGIFANVKGKIKTHGYINYATSGCPYPCAEPILGLLSLELHGHVCMN